MNREEFLIKASAYLGTSVGIVDGKMTIDAPHVFLQLNDDDEHYVGASCFSDFVESDNGDFTALFDELVEIAQDAAKQFDTFQLRLEAYVTEELKAIHPSLNVNVNMTTRDQVPLAQFYLGDTGILLYESHPSDVGIQDIYPESWDNHTDHAFQIAAQDWEDQLDHGTFAYAVTKKRQWLKASGFSLNNILKSNVTYVVREFESSNNTSVPLPEGITAYAKYNVLKARKYVEFTVVPA